MADVTIGELPVAAAMSDDALLPLEQQGEARSIKGELIKQYAQDSVQQYVEPAEQAAIQAAQSASEAAQSAGKAAASADSAAADAQTAQEYSGKPPIIQNGTWWTWDADAQQYQDTGYAARGDVMYATFAVDPATGLLTMTTPDGYSGPVFSLKNGYLEVAING